MVWHHRRPSLRTYWKQQRGYGEAEAMLEAKWPSKYNSFGHVTWSGRLYGKGLTKSLGRWRVYHGFWGCAPFQRLYRGSPSVLASFTLTPEWYLVNLVLAGLFLLSSRSSVLRFSIIALFISVLFPLVSIARSVAEAEFLHDKLRYRILTAVFHIVQPVARFWGRFGFGLTARKRRRLDLRAGLRRQVLRVWSEEWRAPEEWLRSLEKLLAEDAAVRRGGDFDRWDLEVRAGASGTARLKLAIEEHGAGKQMLLFRLRHRITRSAATVLIVLASISAAGYVDHNPWVGAPFAAAVLYLLFRVVADCAISAGIVHLSLKSLSRKVSSTNEAVGSVVYLESSS
jgi:O-antigen biosynthesis protein